MCVFPQLSLKYYLETAIIMILIIIMWIGRGCFAESFPTEILSSATSLSATISAAILSSANKPFSNSKTNFSNNFSNEFQTILSSATSLSANNFSNKSYCKLLCFFLYMLSIPLFFLSIFFILLRIKHTVFSGSLGIFFLSNYIWLEKSNLPLANFFNISLHREKNVFFFLVQSTKAFFFSLQTY